MTCLPVDFDLHTAQPVPFSPAAPTPDQPLRRPRILIRAARAGQAQWRRSRDLARLMRVADAPGRIPALAWLRAEEARLNEARLVRAGDYQLERHVTVLIALLAELSFESDGASAAVSSAPGAEIVPFRPRPTAPCGADLSVRRGTGRPERP